MSRTSSSEDFSDAPVTGRQSVSVFSKCCVSSFSTTAWATRHYSFLLNCWFVHSTFQLLVVFSIRSGTSHERPRTLICRLDNLSGCDQAFCEHVGDSITSDEDSSFASTRLETVDPCHRQVVMIASCGLENVTSLLEDPRCWFVQSYENFNRGSEVLDILHLLSQSCSPAV